MRRFKSINLIFNYKNKNFTISFNFKTNVAMLQYFKNFRMYLGSKMSDKNSIRFPKTKFKLIFYTR